MNEISKSLINWMEHIQALMPASHLTLVGAGTGKGPWVQWLKDRKESCTLVEGEPLRFAALQRLCAASSALENATLLNQFVAPISAEVEVFTANLAQESGLLEPELLHSLWPNLYALHRQSVQAIALASLLAGGSSGQFLILDCLPAATLLKSAQDTLPLLDVVLARVLLADDAGRRQLPQGTGLAELAQALPGFGLQYVHHEAHPGIAYALFARDYRGAWQKSEQIKQRLLLDIGLSRQKQADLLQEKEQEAQANKSLEANLAQAHQKLVSEHQATQAALNVQQQLQEDLLHARKAEVELLQKNDQQAKAYKALEVNLEQLRQELVAERDARNACVEELQQLKTALLHVQKVEAEWQQKNEYQTNAQKELEANLSQVRQELVTERDARNACVKELQQLKVALNHAQKGEAELLQQNEQQTNVQKQLEAKLMQVRQELATERDARNASMKEQQQLKAVLQQAQKIEADLLQERELQTDAQEKLEANLTQMCEALVFERGARKASLEEQQQLKEMLQQTQKAETDLLQKSERQSDAQKKLEANLTQVEKELVTERDARNASTKEKQQMEAEFQKVRQVLENTEKLASQRLAQLSASELRISQLQALSTIQTNSNSELREALNTASAQLDILKRLFPSKTLRSSKEHAFEISDSQENSSTYAKNKVDVKQLACIDLRDAWAGNTVNTVIFRHHGILTKDGYQYTAFYIDEFTLRVVQRHLKNNDIYTNDIKGEFNLKDAHNSISLGIDRNGCLHMSYDHHATRLRYRRCLVPHDIKSWTDELPMTGVYEDKVTYPAFIIPRHDFPLTMLYRDGNHNKGSARIKVYDEKDQSWKDYPTAILSGADNKPWTSNAYWNHPAIGTDGSLHLSFVWRTEMLGEKQLVNNVNVGYAWSPDNGVSWFTSLGKPCKLPITQVNAETVWPVSPGGNLINQCSMALDSKNRPHIAYYANDVNGIPQYQHLWFDGSKWCCTKISERDKSFNLQGGGTLQIPISRPEIVIDDNDRVLVIYRGDMSGDALAFSMLEMENAKYQVTISNEILWPEYIEFSEPVIDRERWRKEKILSCFIQRTAQPDGDRSHEIKSSDLKIVDIIFN
ncbi:BNR-4 repeat-containing protein [Comamonas testosteroni]|uniref:BNR-4 repeat-containing protein n=1 Tax=Comamonas testosteroni TaxID=285 RepID=UPI0018E08753|nr:BNR-4 repeat-containing protein [Comamonas testosteroni]